MRPCPAHPPPPPGPPPTNSHTPPHAPPLHPPLPTARGGPVSRFKTNAPDGLNRSASTHMWQVQQPAAARGHGPRPLASMSRTHDLASLTRHIRHTLSSPTTTSGPSGSSAKSCKRRCSCNPVKARSSAKHGPNNDAHSCLRLRPYLVLHCVAPRNQQSCCASITAIEIPHI
jgi:hypothetical protein